jgi:hypothetical protein
VNPIYYVFFTTATIVASAILFQGFNTTGGVNTISLICGFLVIFMGVYLLNISRQPEKPHHPTSLESGLMSKSPPTLRRVSVLIGESDPRMSMSGRLSHESNNPAAWTYASVPSGANYAQDGTALHGRRSSIYRAQNTTLFSAFEEDGVALTDLPEEEDEEGSEDGDGDRQRGTIVGGRSLLGKGAGSARPQHPAYQES